MYQKLKVEVQYTFAYFHLLKHYVRFQRVTILFLQYDVRKFYGWIQNDR